jgi:hypothetical protein
MFRKGVALASGKTLRISGVSGLGCSMDWFKGKSEPETMVFTIKLVGLSGFNFPIIQFYEMSKPTT